MMKRPNNLYTVFIKPNARTEDDQRRAYLFNILVTGTIALSGLAFLSSAVSKVTRGTHYDTFPLVALATITAFFCALLYTSKRGYYRLAAIIYVVAFFLFATYPLAHWGILLPQGVLTYCLIIIVSGVVLGAQAALGVTVLATCTLLLIERLQSVGTIHFDTAWMQTTGGYNDVVVYGVTFSIVALVSWLSNKQIHQSLQRARLSEKALRLERNLLERRVKERTKELEKAQVEKLEELNRFAEFGRISSTLLHELANPLTAASLNLELMKNKRTSAIYDQLYESISFMEEYVSNARRQLRRQSEIGEFGVRQEIERVVGFLQPKARAMAVEIKLDAKDGLVLTGDSVKFDQIVSNLLANAIDAYEPLLATEKRPVRVRVRQEAQQIVIKVSDHGVGISKKALQHVFDPFYSTKNGDRGTGLGLTITKRAIEEDFGGVITVVSNKEKGTEFTLRLPEP